MKNYYEILEVSENASPEVIEKAYKTLAKKYHPDVQEPNKIKWAEEKFKEIGEAYEILSDKNMRENYDYNLSEYRATLNNNQENNDYQDLLTHTKNLENELETLKKEKVNNNQENEEILAHNLDSITDSLNETIQKAYSDAYHDAYINRLNDYGYNVKHKKSLKTYIKNFITLILSFFVILIILFLLWQIPFVRNYFIDIYNNNYAFQLIVDMFIKK